MKPRKKCIICGTPVHPDLVKYRKQRGWSILCKECHEKERNSVHQDRREQATAKKKQLFSRLRCAQCGMPIKWHDKYLKKSPAYWPITCSPSCHGIYSRRNYRYSREELQDKVRKFIAKRGEWTSWAVVTKQLHITPKVLTKYNINVTELNKQVLGLSYSRHKVQQPVYKACTLHELNEKFGTIFKSHKELIHWYINNSLIKSKDVLEEIILSYISTKHRYCGITALSSDFQLSYERIKNKYKIDVPYLNKKLGFVDTKRSWYQDKMYQMLLEHFSNQQISRQHIFPSCRSKKNFVLRFDFYIPSMNVLIEVDGQQHKGINNRFSRPAQLQNDRIKNSWAQRANIRLFRIPAAPRYSFQERAHKLVLDVVKPVELLEPLNTIGGIQGNQQPSRERRQETEGSETIERGMVQLQLPF